MKYARTLFILTMLAVAALAPLSAQSIVTIQPIVGRVIGVTDADTITVQSGLDTIRVRLYGIDAPESDQPYGPEATAYARKHLLLRKVRLDVVSIDRYDRTIARVHVESEQPTKPFGNQLVVQGYAWHYAQFTPEGSPLSRLENHARTHELGLWQATDPVPPWEWRRTER